LCTDLPRRHRALFAALASFEAWYRDTHPGPFWALFDHDMPETPLVDF